MMIDDKPNDFLWRSRKKLYDDCLKDIDDIYIEIDMTVNKLNKLHRELIKQKQIKLELESAMRGKVNGQSQK